MFTVDDFSKSILRENFHYLRALGHPLSCTYGFCAEIPRNDPPRSVCPKTFQISFNLCKYDATLD